MLALKVCGDVLYRSRDRFFSVCTGPETDVFSLYRSRDQLPVVIEEKEELNVVSEGL